MSSYHPRIGYVPYRLDLISPGDIRRFVAYARARAIKFEIADYKQKYDFVVLSEAADITLWQDYPHGKIVYDLIDSYLSIPRTNMRHWLQGTVAFVAGRHQRLQLDYWESIARMCQRSNAVVCATPEQQELIQAYCQNSHVILDIHTPLITKVKENYDLSRPINLVWEGLPINVEQLLQISDVLRKVQTQHPQKLNLVTDLSYPRFMNRFGLVETLKIAKRIFDAVEVHAWNATSLAETICNFDIAIIPINLADSFVAGKPENKLLLLWRMGLPVVTSATPSYKRAMKNVGTEYLACETQAEWETALNTLIKDKSVRSQAALSGKAYAEEYFSEDILLKKWDDVFSSVGFTTSV